MGRGRPPKVSPGLHRKIMLLHWYGGPDKKGLKQEGIAKKLGISQTTVSRVINGK